MGTTTFSSSTCASSEAVASATREGGIARVHLRPGLLKKLFVHSPVCPFFEHFGV